MGSVYSSVVSRGRTDSSQGGGKPPQSWDQQTLSTSMHTQTPAAAMRSVPDLRTSHSEAFTRPSMQNNSKSAPATLRVLATPQMHSPVALLDPDTSSQSLYVIQQEAGEDGLYHWKLFLANPSSTKSGVWYDVVWSTDRDVGSERRGPNPYTEALSRGFIASHLIGAILSIDVTRFHQVVEGTPCPQYTVADKDKNCQTWLRDVVEGLVKAGILAADALKKVDAVPKEED